MTKLDERTKSRWRAFLGSREGNAMMAFLRENPPVTRFKIDESLEPHHMQFCYGHRQGADQRLVQLEALVKDDPEQPAPLPTIKNTRRIGQT